VTRRLLTSRKLALAARLCFVLSFCAMVWLGLANPNYRHLETDWIPRSPNLIATPDTIGDLVWPVDDNVNPSEDAGGINIPLPDNIQYSVEYNPATGQYEVVQSVGGKFDYRPRTSMTLDEYMNSQQTENISSYWKEIQEEEDEANREYSKRIKVGAEGFENIFGSKRSWKCWNQT